MAALGTVVIAPELTEQQADGLRARLRAATTELARGLNRVVLEVPGLVERVSLRLARSSEQVGSAITVESSYRGVELVSSVLRGMVKLGWRVVRRNRRRLAAFLGLLGVGLAVCTFVVLRRERARDRPEGGWPVHDLALCVGPGAGWPATTGTGGAMSRAGLPVGGELVFREGQPAVGPGSGPRGGACDPWHGGGCGQGVGVCPQMVAYLRQYVTFQERSDTFLSSLVVRARLWGRSVGMMDECVSNVLALSVAEAVRPTPGETAANEYLTTFRFAAFLCERRGQSAWTWALRFLSSIWSGEQLWRQ